MVALFEKPVPSPDLFFNETTKLATSSPIAMTSKIYIIIKISKNIYDF